MIHGREKQRGYLADTLHDLILPFRIALEAAAYLLAAAMVRYFTSSIVAFFAFHYSSELLMSVLAIIFDVFTGLVLLVMCFRIVRAALAPLKGLWPRRDLLGEPTKVEAWISRQRKENRLIVSLPPSVNVSALSDAFPNDDPSLEIKVLDLSSSREKR